MRRSAEMLPLFCWWLLLLAIQTRASIETYNMDEFPQDKIALHFGCVESDMFDTNCACHITCVSAGTHSLTHLLTYSLTHLLNYSLTQTAATTPLTYAPSIAILVVNIYFSEILVKTRFDYLIIVQLKHLIFPLLVLGGNIET